MTPQEQSVLRLVCCAPVAVGSCEPEMSELARRGYVEQFSERVGPQDRPTWLATGEGRKAARAKGSEMEIVRMSGVIWGARIDDQGRTIEPGIDIRGPMGAELLVERLRSEHGPLTAEEELGIIHFAWGRRSALPDRIAADIRPQGE